MAKNDTQNTCRYHCTRCERHFKSLTAFDAHRSEDWRCIDPHDVEGMYLQRRGFCDLTYPDGQYARLADQPLWAYVPPKKAPHDA